MLVHSCNRWQLPRRTAQYGSRPPQERGSSRRRGTAPPTYLELHFGTHVLPWTTLSHSTKELGGWCIAAPVAAMLMPPIESPMHGPWPSNSRPDKRPRETFISFKVKNEQSNDEERRLHVSESTCTVSLFQSAKEKQWGCFVSTPSVVASAWAAAG